MRQAVSLSGVPATMLFALYNRASEARRPDGILKDPDSVRICDAIAHDYVRDFGKPDGLPAMRARLFDRGLKAWLVEHPGGMVVELGAGLETQCLRCDNGKVRWLSVDLPESIDVRERFIPPTERSRNLRMSALDLRWMEEVDASRGLFVTAQGLLMYFEERDVAALLTGVIERFAGVNMMFDTIPRWFSRRTLAGWGKTKHFRAPRMPWGINASEIPAQLRRWSARIAEVHVQPCSFARGAPGLIASALRVPPLRAFIPSVVRLHTLKESEP